MRFESTTKGIVLAFLFFTLTWIAIYFVALFGFIIIGQTTQSANTSAALVASVGTFIVKEWIRE